jgi:hypothetical protein
MTSGLGKKKKKKLSKNPFSCKYQDQKRNTRFRGLQMRNHMMENMPKLIERVLKINDNKDIKIKSALDDGSYDYNKNFSYLQKKKIRSSIKIRKNSIISFKTTE